MLPVLGDGLLGLVRLIILDHHAVDAPEHDGVPFLIKRVCALVARRLHRAQGGFPKLLQHLENATIVSKLLTLEHLLFGRQRCISLLPQL